MKPVHEGHERRAMARGRKARSLKLPVSRCPYPQGHPLERLWLQGWDEGSTKQERPQWERAD